MKQKLDLNNWPRKDHFNFFRQFEDPFFGVTVHIDCTEAYHFSKENGVSFFLYYLYQSLAAANAIEPFKYRIINEEPWVYEAVHASPTINRPDGTFGFAYMDYYDSFEVFLKAAQAEIDRVQHSVGLVPSVAGQNVIHYSSIPWIDFTSLKHATSFSINDSCPKISIGKMTTKAGRRMMPVAIHAHHALMDGYHAAQFIDCFQEKLNG